MEKVHKEENLEIGTNNRHKIQEIQAILFEYELVTPAELALDFDVEKTEKAFEENAGKKAMFLQRIGPITIADDSLKSNALICTRDLFIAIARNRMRRMRIAGSFS